MQCPARYRAVAETSRHPRCTAAWTHCQTQPLQCPAILRKDTGLTSRLAWPKNALTCADGAANVKTRRKAADSGADIQAGGGNYDRRRTTACYARCVRVTHGNK